MMLTLGDLRAMKQPDDTPIVLEIFDYDRDFKHANLTIIREVYRDDRGNLLEVEGEGLVPFKAVVIR